MTLRTVSTHAATENASSSPSRPLRFIFETAVRSSAMEGMFSAICMICSRFLLRFTGLVSFSRLRAMLRIEFICPTASRPSRSSDLSFSFVRRMRSRLVFSMPRSRSRSSACSRSFSSSSAAILPRNPWRSFAAASAVSLRFRCVSSSSLTRSSPAFSSSSFFLSSKSAVSFERISSASLCSFKIRCWYCVSFFLEISSNLLYSSCRDFKADSAVSLASSSCCALVRRFSSSSLTESSAVCTASRIALSAAAAAVLTVSSACCRTFANSFSSSSCCSCLAFLTARFS